MLAAGYPSGIVQLWDVASKQEIIRIQTPPGPRGSSGDYALLGPNWQTPYVPVAKRTFTPLERNGKKAYRFDYAGEIRVWDTATGKEQAPLSPTAGAAPTYALLSPSGRLLLSVERPGYESTDRRFKDVSVIWDLTTHQKWKLCDGFLVPSFSPDEQTIAGVLGDSTLKLFSFRKRAGHQALFGRPDLFHGLLCSGRQPDRCLPERR